MLSMRIKKKSVTNRGSITTDTNYTDLPPTSVVTLPLAKSGYIYELTFDMINDPHGINHGVNYESLTYKIVAYDTDSQNAYAAGDVLFLLDDAPLAIDTEHLVSLNKGDTLEMMLRVSPVAANLNDDYEEGSLNFGIEIVHPIDLSGYNAVFGTAPFGVTAFSEPKELSGVSRGLKSVVGYGEKLIFELFAMSIETEELYEEYIELED